MYTSTLSMPLPLRLMHGWREHFFFYILFSFLCGGYYSRHSNYNANRCLTLCDDDDDARLMFSVYGRFLLFSVLFFFSLLLMFQQSRRLSICVWCMFVQCSSVSINGHKFF